ncbi:hypothetical protein H6P81_017952 [Aristolochia fimbriata]|uniref:Pentatricopeptide repeat-containing protein n=1 Tax=Aristolochia fimbriata TaxID=158543 RepID=A0AAV7E3X7_ARIFI|nr:hypothetical protein H6P81_017952 [Aristolochia fimbriata]
MFWVENQKARIRESPSSVSEFFLFRLGLCNEGKVDAALELVAEMEKKNLGPDHFTYSTILRALTESGRKEESDKFYSKMLESGKLHDKANCATPERAVEGQVETHELGSSEVLDGVPLEHNQEGTSEMLESISDAYTKQVDELCKAGKFKEARYEQHTLKCSSCEGAYNAFQTLQKVLIAATVVLSATASLPSEMMLRAVLGGGAIVSAALAYLLFELQKNFVLVDCVHADIG